MAYALDYMEHSSEGLSHTTGEVHEMRPTRTHLDVCLAVCERRHIRFRHSNTVGVHTSSTYSITCAITHS
jgi:hypothetical protein